MRKCEGLADIFELRSGGGSSVQLASPTDFNLSFFVEKVVCVTTYDAADLMRFCDFDDRYEYNDEPAAKRSLRSI